MCVYAIFAEEAEYEHGAIFAEDAEICAWRITSHSAWPSMNDGRDTMPCPTKPSAIPNARDGRDLDRIECSHKIFVAPLVHSDDSIPISKPQKWSCIGNFFPLQLSGLSFQWFHHSLCHFNVKVLVFLKVWW